MPSSLRVIADEDEYVSPKTIGLLPRRIRACQLWLPAHSRHMAPCAKRARSRRTEKGSRVSRSDTAMPRALVARAPGHPLRGAISAPGDKSISHRALMIGGLAVGE
ncbi:MAG: hypothetical protein ACK55I_07715, partial [bacterium]